MRAYKSRARKWEDFWLLSAPWLVMGLLMGFVLGRIT